MTENNPPSRDRRQKETSTRLPKPRSTSVSIAGCSLIAASLGDFAQGYDGPGPLIFLAAGLSVVLAPWQRISVVAVVTSVFFSAGALVNSEDVTATLHTGEFFPVTGVIVQLTGFAVSATAGCLALRRRPATSSGPC